MNSFYHTYKKPFQKAIQLSLPIMAGQLGQILMGFFDTIQIGGLGAEYIAAAGIANTIYWLITLLGLGILFSISPLVSEAFGEQQGSKAIGIFYSSIKVAIVLSIIFSVAMFLGTYNFEIFKQPENISLLAKRYLYVLNYSTPAMMLFTAGRQLLDGMGRTLPGMTINIAALLLNILLNWMLIYGNLGAPALGIEGAALATSISRLAMMAGVFIFIYQDKKIRQLITDYKTSVFKKMTFVQPILTIGIPASLQIFAEAAAFSVAHIMCGWISETALAAHQIAINLASIAFMTVTGISAAGTIMTGYAFGAKDKTGIRVNGYTVIMLVLAVEALFVVCFFSLHHVLPLLYTQNVEVIALASSLILLAVGFQVSDGLQNVAVGVLRGIQDVRIPAILAFTSYWIVMIPSCYVLAFNFNLGVSGIWIGFIIGLSTAAVLLLLRFKYLASPARLQLLVGE